MIEKKLSALGVAVAEIQLPNKNVDMDRWGVVACDQYTAQPEYWERAYKLVGDHPSTLAMILPEAFLGTDKESEIGAQTPLTMAQYLNDGVLENCGKVMILVERDLGGRVRTGLMVALDLEQYDYSAGSQSLIRATEKTIVERIPPRMKIREKALVELPHIMVLIDDPADAVMDAARSGVDRQKALYRANLMAGGGKLAGYKVNDNALENIASALEALTLGQEHPMLFAMGDGNHSLATAKACWEKIKPSLSEEERKEHPARFALVEVVNLHDKGLEFEPIHRVIFGTEPEAFIKRLEERLAETGCSTHRGPEGPGCPIGLVTEKGEDTLWLEISQQQLPVAVLQPALDAAVLEGEEQDFIHGEDAVKELSKKAGRVGLLLPPFAKDALFPTVQEGGPLPRKSFSMGEAHEKRFYFECRRIR